MKYFSHASIRPSQQELIELIEKSLKTRRHVVVHAPTGLGKTAAALCPALELALEREDLTVFFLTSRHTQQRIVLETVEKIHERHGVVVPVSCLIGKKWMCAQDGADSMRSSDFAEFCKTLVEGGACEFFSNAREKKSAIVDVVVSELKADSPLPAESVLSRCVRERLCPYEVSLMLAEKAKLIVCDYFYIFHPHIRNTLFGRIKKKLENIIIIVDEAHNVPARVRDVLTFRLNTRSIRLALSEARKSAPDYVSQLLECERIFAKLASNLKGDEMLVKKEDLVSLIDAVSPYDEFVENLEVAAEVVREQKKTSFIGRVSNFLSQWRGGDVGFARILRREDDGVTLSVRCLDPSLLTKDVFEQCHSSVVMSGTLSPTSMYGDILGLHANDYSARIYPSPYGDAHILPVIVPKTTTKFSARSEEQFRRIGETCALWANRIPGSVLIFFPSYNVRNAVYPYFVEHYEKTVFQEMSQMSKDEKQSLLDRFVAMKSSGAALLAVTSGSFGEGVDLPGVLKGVIVVGLPLERPDLETTELIAYYDKKFSKGWDYGYTLPAMTRCIQNAGRCVRSDTDKGVLIFLDERFAWPQYKKFFPPDWNVKITTDVSVMDNFFGR